MSMCPASCWLGLFYSTKVFSQISCKTYWNTSFLCQSLLLNIFSWLLLNIFFNGYVTVKLNLRTYIHIVILPWQKQNSGIWSNLASACSLSSPVNVKSFIRLYVMDFLNGLFIWFGTGYSYLLRRNSLGMST